MVTNNQRRGIMWVNDYPQPNPLNLPSLPYSGACAEGFYDTLLPQGVSNNGFKHGDSVASSQKARDTDIQQEKVFFKQGTSVVDFIYPPGEDAAWAEAVDMLYFCGHGDQGNLHFGHKNPTAEYSDTYAHYDDIALGDGSIKWLVADACSVLENNLVGGTWSIYNRWARIFKPNGSLRYILGFHTSCKNDNFRGKIFAEKLNPVSGSTVGEYIRIAWQYACEKTDNGEWAYLRVGDPLSPIKDDRWTDVNTLANIPVVQPGGVQTFTYQRRIDPDPATPPFIINP